MARRDKSSKKRSQGRGPPVRYSVSMTISGQSPVSLLDSVLQAQTTQTDIGVAVLKKVQDAVKQQGEAMVKMLAQAAPQPDGRRLDAYA